MECCCCCGQNNVSMSTNNPNASVNQSVCCCRGCGGAANMTSTLTAIGKWGTVLTASIQGKPVATSPGGVAIGAKGSTFLPGQQASSTTMIVIVLIIAAILFVALKR